MVGYSFFSKTGKFHWFNFPNFNFKSAASSVLLLFFCPKMSTDKNKRKKFQFEWIQNPYSPFTWRRHTQFFSFIDKVIIVGT